MNVEIAFSLNQGIMVGLLAAMNSVVKNTACPERLKFHIAVPPEEVEVFEAAIQRFFPHPSFKWQLGSFTPPDFLRDYLHNKFHPQTDARRWSRYMQYARLFLRDIFPDLGKVLYLDSDVIALGDVATLFDAHSFTPTLYFAAVPHFFPAILYFGKPWHGLKEAFAFEKSFNSGVILTDVRYWNEDTYQSLRHYLDWDASHQYGLLNLGDETVLNLMFKHYLRLDPSWNRCGYGNPRFIAWLLKKPLKDVNLIHWSGGHHKPWKTNKIAYGHLWRQYASPNPG